MIRLRSTICLALLAFFAVSWANDVVQPRITMENFKARELNDDGTLAWLLFGKRAITSGNRVVLESARATINSNGDEYLVLSPECDFDRKNRFASSDQAVQLRSETMLITGTGFDLDLSKNTMSIRRNVRLLVFKSSTHLLGKPSEKE